MGLVSFFAKPFQGIVKGATELVDELHVSGEEKQDFALKMQKVIDKSQVAAEKSLQAALKAHVDIVEAELKQDDLFTKRMRPTIGYAGIGAAVVLPVFIWGVKVVAWATGADLSGFPDNPLAGIPDIFWTAWAGVTGIYAMGRSMEKRGVQNKIVDYVTGSKKSRGLLNL